MYVKKELQLMFERMFSENLFKTVLEGYIKEMDEDGTGISEQEYIQGKKELALILNEEQTAALLEMESLCEKNVKYALRFGFTQGTYVGFQQFFVEETTQEPFEDFVVNQLLTEPHMKRYGEYYQRRTQFNEINRVLEIQLDNNGREHLISVYSGWENRLYGVLRHAFYMGYRYALSIINEVGPCGTYMKIIDKILLTEHELCFTRTVTEREQRDISFDI